MNSRYWEVLCRMYFDIPHMERRELRHDRHMVSLLTDNTIFSRNGALKVWGCHPASMVLGHGWGVAREIYTKSGEAECKNAMYRLRT